MELAVLLGIGAAAFSALIVALIAWRPWRKDVSLGAGRVGGAAACGLAWAACYLAVIRRPPSLPPGEQWQWLFFVGLAATLLGTAFAALPLRRWTLVPVALLAGASVLVAPLTPDEAPVWLWMTGAAIGVAAMIVLLEPLAARRPGPTLALALAVCAGGAAVVLMMSGNERLARLMFSVPTALLVLAAIAWRRPSACPGPGAIVAVAPLLVGTLLAGQYYSYSQVPVWSYLLPCAAPLLLWLGEIPFVRRAPAPIGVLVRLAAVVLPTALAVFLAVRVTDTDLYYGVFTPVP